MQLNEKINSLIKALNESESEYTNRRKASQKALPSRELTEKVIYGIRDIMFREIFAPYDRIEKIALSLQNDLAALIGENNEDALWEIMRLLPDIKVKLLGDASAIYDGDPAAYSYEEVILTYPGFFATLVYRVAHELYLLKLRYIPRLMSEIAHEKTGIDIHPGASIGERLCIDHGTGIVIGETASIGDRVKIYQGVTIGAKSFEADSAGRLIKGGKRHPDIGNDCIIYAGATILGGETKIGDGCVIGGNVWITRSVASGEKIYYKER